MPSHRDLFLSLGLVLVAPLGAVAQNYERVDVDSAEQPANAPAGWGDISHDGRYVAFVSSANNLGGPDVGFFPDLFLRDRLLGTTTQITTSSANDLEVKFPCMNGDGSMIAFVRSAATTLIPRHSYLYVASAGTSSEVLVPGFSDIGVEALSSDGRFAVITTPLSGNARRVDRLDLVTGATVLCSRDQNGNPVEGFDVDIDDDGTHVAFGCANALVAGDTNGIPDVYVYDIPGNVMLRASVGQNGEEPNQQCRFPSLSGDGRYVIFGSPAANIVPTDGNGVMDVFMRDMRLGSTTIVTITSLQVQLGFQQSQRAFLSADASSVALGSLHKVTTADSDNSYDTFVRDIEPGVLLPASPGAAGFESSLPLALTRDGREVLIFTEQPALGAASTHGQLFVSKFGPRCSSMGYCSALPNSTGKAGSIGAQGDASRQLNNLVISAVGLPDTANAMLVSGTSAVDPGTPFGNGLMCIGGALIRHGIHVAIGGVILDAQDMQSAEYAGVNPGDTRYYQVVYRDPPAGGALFNTTDAVAITFCW